MTTTTVRTIEYPAGGYQPDQPQGGALRIIEQEIDDETGEPVGDPVVIYEANTTKGG